MADPSPLSPTPWQVEYRLRSLPTPEDATKFRLCGVYLVLDEARREVFHCHEALPAPVAEANARLAAKAPDLFRALDRLLDVFDEMYVQGDRQDDLRIIEARNLYADLRTIIRPH